MALRKEQKEKAKRQLKEDIKDIDEILNDSSANLSTEELKAQGLRL